MRIADYKNLEFQLYSNEPLIVPPRFTPLLADPTVLTLDGTPDGSWHLFAHTVFGVTHYRSADGISWNKKRVVFRAAMRPFIFKEADTYYLFYEKYDGLKLVFSPILKSKWHSRLEVRSSKDLRLWSEAKILITPHLPFHSDVRLGDAVSNPCLIKAGNKYRLYFSSSLVRIPDCGFNEPLHITYAESENITGPYSCHEQPVISPAKEKPWCNLGAGSMKVILCEDGYVAFQNGIFEHDGVSGSAICLLHSADGIKWQYLKAAPILKPNPENSWMASHIYACDVKIFQGKVFLYFNARNHPHWSKGSEKIGLAVANI